MGRKKVLHTATESFPQQVQNLGPGSPKPSVYPLVHLDEEDGTAVFRDVDVSPEPSNKGWREGCATGGDGERESLGEGIGERFLE